MLLYNSSSTFTHKSLCIRELVFHQVFFQIKTRIVMFSDFRTPKSLPNPYDVITQKVSSRMILLKIPLPNVYMGIKVLTLKS